MMNHTHDRRTPLRIVLLLILHLRSTDSFCTSPIYDISSQPLRRHPREWFSTFKGLSYDAVLDFTQPKTIDKVDRLDDAIMGGVSTSSVQPGNGYAIWAGICRTDGGGFCGFRTNPFETPLMVPANATGLYVEMKLVSDDEPQRRIWKMTTRTRPDRGEQLYQSPLYWNSSISRDFNRLVVPFEEFQLVRGARRILDGPPLNYTAGLYQLGMSMSKFAWEGELGNFREGVFQVHIKEIGIYYSAKDEVNALESSKPGILSKEETKRKQPLVVKILLPALRVMLFSEASQRRKSAFRLIRKRWKLSRLGTWRWSLRRRVHALGILKGVVGWGSIFFQDASRLFVSKTLQITLFYPLLLLRRLILFILHKVS